MCGHTEPGATSRLEERYAGYGDILALSIRTGSIAADIKAESALTVRALDRTRWVSTFRERRLHEIPTTKYKVHENCAKQESTDEDGTDDLV